MFRKRLAFIIVIVLIVVFICFEHSYGQNLPKPLHIGVASMITPVDTVKYYQDIVGYISDKMNVQVEMVHRRTYEEMDRMLEENEVAAAFICSASYVMDKREFGVELLVAPQLSGSVFYHSYIIVHKDSAVNNFNGLKGKTFAFTDPKSNSGKLYPEYHLTEMGVRPEDFFENYIFSYSHNKSVELVAKKIVSGAAVESLVYEYMSKNNSPYASQTKVIQKSPAFGIPPVVVTKYTPSFIKEKLREIFMEMHHDPEGRKILDAMFIERFVQAPDSNYDSIREMESVVSRYSGKGTSLEKPKNTVYFGVIPSDNPRISFEKFQPLMDFLSENSSFKYELILKKTYEDTVNAFGQGDIDIALLDPLTYLEAHAKYGAISILKGITAKGESFERSAIITSKDSEIEKLSDLRGKVFAFASTKSTSGNLIPRYLLAGAGIHLRDLRHYHNFNYHDSVVKWILRGKYDAGAVRRIVAEKYLPLGLKILKFSKPIPSAPVVISPKTPYIVAEKTKSILLDLTKTEKGNDLLKKLDPGISGGFTEANDSDYEKIRKMINDVPKTCGIGCHPKIKL